MKRSTQVSLVLMAAAGIGGTAYALQSRGSCAPPPPSAVANDVPQDCRSSRGVSSSGHSSGWHFFNSGSGSANSGGAGTTTPVSSSGTVERGGFGSIGRAFASFARGA